MHTSSSARGIAADHDHRETMATQARGIIFAMDAFVFVAVLFAAACHAGWNATIKGGLDPLATTVLISIGAAIVAAVFLPVVGLRAAVAWPWCGASVLIHLAYFAALI